MTFPLDERLPDTVSGDGAALGGVQPVDAVLGRGGLLARAHRGFECRSGQLQMARAVAAVLQTGGRLCVEAGTGTGKTLAYLTPAVLSGEPALISTATKHLQDQILEQDVPRLESALGRKLRVVTLKGRKNYLCLHRLERLTEGDETLGADELGRLSAIEAWAETTATGERAELSDLPDGSALWDRLDARSETCIGLQCPHYAQCFITRARARAREADLVVINHHLLFADLAARRDVYGAFLPDIDRLILDEAHEIEHTAAEYFSVQVSAYRLAVLVRDVEQTFTPDTVWRSEVWEALLNVRRCGDAFWDFVAHRYGTGAGGDEGRGRLSPDDFRRRDGSGAGDALGALAAALERLSAALNAATAEGGSVADVERLAARADAYREDLLHVTAVAGDAEVAWWERRGRGWALRSTPIDVASLLRESLFKAFKSVVLTSATLTTHRSFRFIRSRLGLDDAFEMVVDSPFAYAQQARLYLPAGLPDPNDPGFIAAAVEAISELLAVTQGRAFVLCTSLNYMRRLYAGVRARTNFPCFLQGEASKGLLLERFRRTSGAVLFGAASFWQGVDIRGDALSCVIVDRLPFPSPADPVVEARCRRITAAGGDAFLDYSLPQAILWLRQGFGRLIRSRRDHGVLCLLDPRIRKWYGRLILQSLPAGLPVVEDLGDLGRWFASFGAPCSSFIR